MDMEQITNTAITFLTTYGIKVVGAILILIVGRIAAGIIRNGVRKALGRTGTAPAVVSFIASMTYALVLAFTVVAVLSKFGVETASFVAVLGAAGFAVGFALQGSLSNFASGVMILVLRPFGINDVIDAAGVVGKVTEISLFTTVLTTPDNVRILVPNSKIFGDVIKNITANDTRRLDLVIGIGYGSSMKKAKELLDGIISEESRCLKDPEPTIAVAELADSSVNLYVRPWVKKEDYWNVKFDLTEKIKNVFDENDIEIPFPQRTVHMVNENPA